VAFDTIPGLKDRNSLHMIAMGKPMKILNKVVKTSEYWKTRFI